MMNVLGFAIGLHGFVFSRNAFSVFLERLMPNEILIREMNWTAGWKPYGHLLRAALITLLFVGFKNIPVTAQTSSTPDTADFPYWAEMMKDPNANFYETQRAFNLYWEGREIERGSGWKPFKRWEYMMESRIAADGTKPAPDHVFKAYQEYQMAYQASHPAESVDGDWQILGPVQQPIKAGFQPNGMGRVNCVAFHPTDPLKLYVGAPSGGFWYSSDGGQSWDTSTDQLPTLGISSIVVNSVDPDIIYIGTGDRDGGDAPGLGVFRSTDGGLTWTQYNNGMGTPTVGDMIMHPFDPMQLFAATSNGIFKTTDGGANWTKVSVTDNFEDIAFMPGNTNIMYASADGEFFRSINNGNGWTEINTIPASSRMMIGVTPANPDYVYCLLATGSTFLAVYRSTDAGQTFQLRADSPNLMDWSVDGSGTGGQAWYDLCIAVDPVDEDVVYTGGINIWKSTNGGQDWNSVTHWIGDAGRAAVHADQHALVFSPHNNRFYSGNDGGLHYSDDGGTTWPEISSGLVISQIYRMGQSASDQNFLINGYQDNGSALYDNGTWRTEIGADGMECAIDPNDPNYVYGSIYFGSIRRSTDRGQEFQTIAAQGVSGITEGGAWVTPYALHVTDPNTMFIGYKNLWRGRNIKSNNPVFEQLSNGLAGNNSQNMRDIHQSAADPDLMYMSRTDNKFFRSDNINADQPEWVELTGNQPITGRVEDIETDPNNPDRVFVVLGSSVYESNDRGETWIEWSGTLPSVSKNCIAFNPLSNSGLYLGTDAGIYYRDETLTDWIPFNMGLPVSVIITEMEFAFHPTDPSQLKLRAASYGRGLWESDPYDSGNLAPAPSFLVSSRSVDVCQNIPVTFADYSAYEPSSWNWSFSPATVTFVGGTDATSANPQVTFDAPGTYDVTLQATNSNGTNTVTRAGFITVLEAEPFPYYEDFENFTLCTAGSFGNCNVPCTPTNGWQNDSDTDDDQNWITNSGPTKLFTELTGPQQDFNPGSFDGKYMYVESNGCGGQMANLISPCIDLSEAIDPELRFAFHMTSPISVGSLSIDVFVDGTWENDIIDPLASDFNLVWIEQRADLLPYKGKQIKIRFRGTPGNNQLNDIGLDDVQVREKFNAGIESVGLNGDVKVYPNPANGQFFLDWKGGDEVLDVELIDAMGRPVWQEQFTGSAVESISPGNLSAGIYVLRLRQGNRFETIRMVMR